MMQARVMIIGAGPIGLELAVALKRLGVDYVHLEAGQIGQTVSWYPRQARFFSSPERIAIAGVPLHTADQTKATREEYLAYLRGVVEQFDLDVRTYERVTHIERDPERSPAGGFIVRSARGDEQYVYAVDYVVLAVGDMHAPRRLHIPGEDLDHVDHYFEEPHRYFRQRLLIVGGRNSAAEAALRCHRAGAKVAISYRQPHFDAKAIKYWLLPELESLIKHGQIAYYPCTVPTQITSTHVTLAPSRHPDCPTPPDQTPADAGPSDQRLHNPALTDGQPFTVRADFVLLLTGYVMDTTLFELAGVELVGENRAPHVDPETMQTNVPGLFAAGTAVAGTQVRFRLFIENCHPHVTKIVRAITGQPAPADVINQAARQFDLPES